MKTYISLLVVFVILYSNALAVDEEKTITVGTVDYHVNDGKGFYTWNGQDDENCRCWDGSSFSCWFEQVNSINSKITHIFGENSVTFSGDLTSIDVIVTVAPGQQLSLEAQSSSFVVPDCYYIMGSSEWFEDIPLGTVIDIESFTTNPDGSYIASGTIRQ